MKRISYVLCALLISASICAQEENQTKYQPKFGFNLGVNQSELYNSDASDELTIDNGYGFRLGVFAELPIAGRWSVHPKAELSFNNDYVTQDDQRYRVDPYNLNFMTHINFDFKSWSKNVHPVGYIGPSVRVPLTREFDGVTYDTKAAFALDFAFGYRIDVEWFYITPMLRYSAGLTDIRSEPFGETLRGSYASFMIAFTGK